MNLVGVESYGRSVAAPYAGEIYGLPISNFGTSEVGGLRSYTPQNINLDALSSIVTDGESSVRQFSANTFIQHSYSLVPFRDGSEKRIMENMLVFVARHIDKKHGQYPFVSIGKLNPLMREHHRLYGEWLSSGDPQTVFFEGRLNDETEEKLQFYDHLRYTNDSNGIAKFLGENEGFDKFYDLATQDVYCYQTEFGIRARWNFSGVVLSKMQGTSLMSMDLTASTSELYNINVVVGEKARVFNYWGSVKDTKPGSKVFLVLKRAQTKDDNQLGPFQFYTYATALRETVPDNFRKYLATTGETKKYNKGWCKKIGTVSEHSGKNPNEATKQAALGLNCTEKMSYDACSTLPIMYIQLGI